MGEIDEKKILSTSLPNEVLYVIPDEGVWAVTPAGPPPARGRTGVLLESGGMAGGRPGGRAEASQE